MHYLRFPFSIHGIWNLLSLRHEGTKLLFEISCFIRNIYFGFSNIFILIIYDISLSFLGDILINLS